ncbi:MAG: hypothetical protein P1V20_27405 [Verrucomicrobiales bacterium]|nr:hypothetical protein [Verrucomicrobiales bacterium]
MTVEELKNMPKMKKIAWGSYVLVGISSVFFLSGLIVGGEPIANQSFFRFWALAHTLTAGIIGIKSIDDLGRLQSSNLVKLTGYLYTLTGLILAIEHIESDTASIFSGAGGALLSSLVGWFFGGLIEREDTPFVSAESISLALDPKLTEQLNSELQATADVLGTSRASLIEAEQELAQHRALLEQANQLLEEVNKFISEDPSRRQIEESHRDEVLQELVKLNGRLS